MATRSRSGVTRAWMPGLLLVLAAGCAGTSTRSGSEAPPAPEPAHAPTKILGDAATRSIVVTTYERQAFLELAMQPAVRVRGRRAVLERWTRDPTFSIAGTPTVDDLRRIAEAVQRWSLITGRHLTVITGPADVTLHFVPRAQFASVLGVDE